MKFNISNISVSKNDIKRNLILPSESSEELAEFMGILAGDGFINYYPYQYKYLMEIAGDSKLDYDYLTDYVNKLIKNLFNLDASFSKKRNQNTMSLILISKGLISYLAEIGFPKGKKRQIKIPKWILSDKDYMISFIKGVADTDGSIYFRKGKYPIIKHASISRPLTKEISSFLKKQGFKVNYYKEKQRDKRFNSINTCYSITMNGKNNLSLWLSLISFRNKRHLRKINGNVGI